MEIKVSNTNLKAIIDDADAPLVAHRTWYLDIEGYPTTRLLKKEGKKLLRMHRVLITPPKGLFIDHIDNNRLNNRRSNLRIATKAQNMMNRGAPIQNTSGFKGVVWDPVNKKWVAQITANGKSKKIGRFRTKTQAAMAYNQAAKIYHGEFAYLNKI